MASREGRGTGALFYPSYSMLMKKEVTSVPVEIIAVSGKLLQVKIRGVLTKADHERIIRIARKRSPSRQNKMRYKIGFA